MTDWNEYEDAISDAICDSIDMDWTSRTGAKAVVAWLNENAPAAPQAAGVGEPTPEQLEPFARKWCEANGIDPDAPKAPHGEWPEWYDACAPFAAMWRDIAAHLRAPSREPEGGAVRDEIERLIAEAVLSASVEIPETLGARVAMRESITRNLTNAIMKSLATREEAPAEAGEALGAAENLHAAATIYEDQALLEDAETVLKYIRAQPQAREDAQPVADVVEPIERAVATLKGHIEAIQVAKADGGSSSVITDCVNGLPEIVRWMESGLFSVEAAFEQYEDAHPAHDALRVAVEALEPFAAEAQRIRAPQSAKTIMDNVELWQCGSANITRTRLTYGDLRKAVDALAALQAEQKGGA